MYRHRVRHGASGLLLFTAALQAGSFDAASIKRAMPDAYASSGEDGRSGVLRMWNVTLKRCIRYAYEIPEARIVGGPAWIDDSSYDILAKADHAARRTGTSHDAPAPAGESL